MRAFRKGDINGRVTEIQTLLSQRGFSVAADGHFGAKTDLAVRSFQRRNGLLPDGIVGQQTYNALAQKNSAKPNKSGFQDFGLHVVHELGSFLDPVARFAYAHFFMQGEAKPIQLLSISDDGLDFIYRHEAEVGVSNSLHWPGGASGVTLGPGYDMKERSPLEISSDMLSIGLTFEQAQKIAAGSGLTKSDARKFAVDNKKIVNLRPDQEKKLLEHVVPNYESLIKKQIRVQMTQYEYDSLVSFAYNPGGRLGSVARLINQGETSDAMSIIKSVNKSGGEVMGGLTKRREDEVGLYLYAKYK